MWHFFHMRLPYLLSSLTTPFQFLKNLPYEVCNYGHLHIISLLICFILTFNFNTQSAHGQN